MSGRIRRLLRTVPKGAVDVGIVPALAAAPIAAASDMAPRRRLSPARWLARRLLADRLAGVPPQHCRVLGTGRLVDVDTLPFDVRTEALPAADNHALETAGLHILVIGDALGALDHPPAALRRLLAGITVGQNGLRVLIVLPGTALLPDDDIPCPRRWLFSEASGRAMAGQLPDVSSVTVTTSGNVLAASAELLDLAADHLWPDELAADDPQYPMIVAVEMRLMTDPTGSKGS